MTGSPVNVDDFEEAARARLDPGAYGYFAGGAGDEHTLRANAAAFAGWELRPRVLVDVGEVSTATTVLGTEVELPAARRADRVPAPGRPGWRARNGPCRRRGRDGDDALHALERLAR